MYCRTSSLPFRLILESSESLSLFSDPGIFNVCLVRNISRLVYNPSDPPVDKLKSDPNNTYASVMLATVWTPKETTGTSDENRKEFHGEFALHSSVVPSFEFIKPSVRVSSLTYKLVVYSVLISFSITWLSSLSKSLALYHIRATSRSSSNVWRL